MFHVFSQCFFFLLTMNLKQKSTGSQGETGFDFRALQPDMVDVTCRD